MIGKEEYGESAKEFTKVRATDNNLCPSTNTESALGVGGGKRVLQKPVEVESQSVTGEEPCETVERSPNAGEDREATYRRICGCRR